MKPIHKTLLVTLLIAVALPLNTEAQQRLVDTSAQQRPSGSPDFKGRYLVTLSDTDMVATAYVDGQLGERQPGVVDTLSVVPLPDSFRSRGLGARQNPVGQVNVSNSVNGIGNSMVLSRDGKVAYVIEVKAPAPKNATKFDEQVLGTKLSVVSLANPMKPTVVQQIAVGRAPEAIDINPTGDLLAVVTGDTGKLGEAVEANKRIQLIPLRDGQLGTPQNFPLTGVEDGQTTRASNIKWHPSGRFLAVNVPLKGQVVFYQVVRSSGASERATLVRWGKPVTAGKFPANGYFTPDGRFFITNALQWGEDVEGFFNNPPTGQVVSIRFGTQGTSDRVVHEVVSTTSVGQNPESLRISPDGTMVVTANMRNTGLLWNDPRLTTESSLSLVTIERQTGRLATIGSEYMFEGILPQGLAFDANGTGLAVTLLDHFDLSARQGAVEFWRVIPGSRPTLVRTGFSVSVVRGPYQLLLIP